MSAEIDVTPGTRKSKSGNVVAELLAPRQDEAAEAAVDVQADAALEREVGQLRRSGRSCRSRSCTPSPTIAIVFSSISVGHRVDVDQRGLRGRPAPRRQLDAEQVARLVERGVPGLGLHEVRPVDAARLARVLAVREHRVQDAAAAARGDEPDRVAAVVDRVGVQQVEGHGDDLALELRHARADVALQRVHVREQLEGAAHELVVLVVAAVHRARDLAGLPRLCPRRGRSPRARRGSTRGCGPSDGMPRITSWVCAYGICS